ncbi:molybdenum cofactor guanylyltransferase MobA [Neotabrizicola sp. sgz301269]|uniref:molybdenum cofactor guanylyltransferase MobA n=1 Tax=Neotabrizicola sp. sgz301269 TaxID=3276282 RepID=UPI0037700933
MRIAAVILAGGQSRRMGQDKALVRLAGRPLLAHVQRALSPQVAALALSANGDPARFAEFGLTVLPDSESIGPLSGVLAGLRWAAAQGAQALVSAPVDAPFLPEDLVARLSEGGTDAPALAESGGVMHPAVGLWPVALADALEAFLASGAKARVRDFALSHGGRAVAFPDPACFLNLNTPEDLAGAEARLL